jgi:RNA-splicing ligase RtcB
MLHSGSRGVGNFIGTMFIELAKQDAMRNNVNLPDRDLAYFEEGSALLRRLRARGGLGPEVCGA